MTLVNMTPHVVALETTRGDIVTLPSVVNARNAESIQERGTLLAGDAEVRLVSIRYAAAVLPAEVDGCTLIVSLPVAERHPERRDLVYPADFARDEDGRIIYARALARFEVGS